MNDWMSSIALPWRRSGTQDVMMNHDALRLFFMPFMGSNMLINPEDANLSMNRRCVVSN